MSHPLVIGYHLVWTAYGWWLPNDPRGSMSNFVHSDILFDLGQLHYGRKRIQPAARDVRAFYEEAKGKLQFNLLEMTAPEVKLIADAFQDVIWQEEYMCYACALMPDHVHILIRKHKHAAEDMIANLQFESRFRLRDFGLRTADHPVWGGPGWKVFLDSPEDIRRTIRYIEDNPLKMGLPAQKWGFVKAYDGWPLHRGHSPNSPYARRLRGLRDG
jgi:REP element-mobilizing transposase RayT